MNYWNIKILKNKFNNKWMINWILKIKTNINQIEKAKLVIIKLKIKNKEELKKIENLY